MIADQAGHRSPPDFPAIITAEAQARKARAEKVVLIGDATPEEAAADELLWRALLDWAKKPRWRADGTRLPPACGWEPATTATARAAAAALKTYQDQGGDPAPLTPAKVASGRRWQSLNTLAHELARWAGRDEHRQEAA